MHTRSGPAWLVAVHALGGQDIRTLLLADIDLAHGRLHVRCVIGTLLTMWALMLLLPRRTHAG
ncbi:MULTISPECIES: hypothetical protein [unclassified Streptomyces]|uniref:hypothetical protein n=1 Tax=unclassified Streptomyces TaxID=2593676 RepID=UPI0033B9C4C5